MSGAPIISGSTKFASPANTGITNRKMSSVACTENTPLNCSGVRNCIPGLASWARISIASRPPDEQEEERGDRVLDADHLVVGVDAEVVAPAVRAVSGVVLGARGPAGGPVEPVIEGAEADQEEQRHRDQRDDRDRVAVDDRVLVHQPPDQDGQAERECEAEHVEQRCPVPPGSAELAGTPGSSSSAAAAKANGPGLPSEHLHEVAVLGHAGPHFVTLEMKLTSAWT